MSYEDQTKEELQEELRDRDLKVSGTKEELIERLEEDDTTSDSGDGSRSRDRLTPREAIRSAVHQLAELGGREVDGVSGFEGFDGGWRVLVEVVEVARVPPTTDVLGAYEVTINNQGELVGYERIRRFVRGQAGGDDE